MTVVNFTIPKNLEKRIVGTVKERGFASKAEFFRFSAIYFMDVLQKRAGSEEERFEHLTKLLQEEISERYRGRKLPTLKEQLSDV